MNMCAVMVRQKYFVRIWYLRRHMWGCSGEEVELEGVGFDKIYATNTTADLRLTKWCAANKKPSAL